MVMDERSFWILSFGFKRKLCLGVRNTLWQGVSKICKLHNPLLLDVGFEFLDHLE